MTNIVIITSNGIRHKYFSTMFSNSKNINVKKIYKEYDSDYRKNIDVLSDFEIEHYKAREQTEYDFFSDIIHQFNNQNKLNEVSINDINNEKYLSELKEINPDFIITYGCSIVKKDILEAFKDKILNVHLGISPYYLGSGTNFISLLNNDFQCVGYTLMYMDSGIDTGEIIHQSRAKIFQFDNIHQIGNRLIKDMTSDFIYLVNNFHLVKKMSYPDIQHESIICLNKHVTVDAVKKIYKSFSDGGVENFLKKQEKINKLYPIIQQEFMSKK